MKHYVLGFAFTRDMKTVILIKKNKPTWQAGFYNGVGGKVEDGETPRQAMVREFLEETGAETVANVWGHFATLVGTDWTCPCFFYFSDHVVQTARTITTEAVMPFDIHHINPEYVLPNVRYLIDMALDLDLSKPVILPYGTL